MRILVVEDDPGAARFLKQGLEEEGYVIDVAVDGEDGAQQVHLHSYDLVVLDVMLPRKSGFELSREMRRNGIDSPILMLTARDSTDDIVNGLNAGADEYLTKPFSFEELLARVRATTRRHIAGPAGLLHYADVELDRLAGTAARAGRRLDLSPREFRLLEYFLLHAEEVVTRTALLERVWHMSFDPETNLVEAHVSNLRKKLGEGGRAPLIRTVRGSGYILRQESAQ